MKTLERPVPAPSRALRWLHERGLALEDLADPAAKRRELVGPGLLTWVCADDAEVGRCVLFDLDRAAAARHSAAACVAAFGFTLVAHDWAERRGIALFGLDIVGDLVPLNAAARELTGSGRLLEL
ncbi:MAG: hypothetical protein ACT4QF_04045 [Sporichthyaceae bacterium]